MGLSFGVIITQKREHMLMFSDRTGASNMNVTLFILAGD